MSTIIELSASGKPYITVWDSHRSGPSVLTHVYRLSRKDREKCFHRYLPLINSKNNTGWVSGCVLCGGLG